MCGCLIVSRDFLTNLYGADTNEQTPFSTGKLKKILEEKLLHTHTHKGRDNGEEKSIAFCKL